MDPLKTVPASAIQSEEPVPEAQSEAEGPRIWGEEERRNVAAFFRLLDHWDRRSSRRREAA